MEASGAGLVDGVGRFAFRVLVAATATDALIAAGAEGPAAVLLARSVAGEQYGAHVGRHPGVVECPVQLVDGVWAKRIAYLGAVEGDTNCALTDMAVISDVGEILESGNWAPKLRVEGHVGHDRGRHRNPNDYLE